jgi:hypothetical protein
MRPARAWAAASVFDHVIPVAARRAGNAACHERETVPPIHELCIRAEERSAVHLGASAFKNGEPRY